MATRQDLQKRFESLLGSQNVYFQPPESIKIDYPAIIYGLEDIENTNADDGVYLFNKKYWVTLIDKNPDSLFVDMIAKLPTCIFDRHFTNENLNNWRFSLYF